MSVLDHNHLHSFPENSPYLTRPHFANQTAKEVFDYFMFNFKRFNKTRAPFSINQHMYWFLLENQAILEGFLQFLDHLGSLDYVYIVPVSKASIAKPIKLKNF